VVCIDAGREDEAYPCGQCRQRLNEFNVDLVIVAIPGGEVRVHSFDELFPHRFQLDR
jgi:cytidine deaminase